MSRMCTATGPGWSCSRKHYARGLCNSHYKQAARGPLFPLNTRQRERKLSLEAVVERFVSRAHRDGTGCLVLTEGARGSGGYPHVRYQGRTRTVAQLVVEHTIGPANGLDVRHLCNNRLCVDAAHLTYGTRAENMHDRSLAGRNAAAKLAPQDVQDVRSYLSQGCAASDIAKLLGVTDGAIRSIGKGLTWRWLPSPA